MVPLVLATVAAQASIVVLAPLVVAIGEDLGASLSAVGLARSVLAGTAATIRCRWWRTYDGGDHLIILGEVESTEIHDREPLIFHRGAFGALRRPTADATSDPVVEPAHRRSDRSTTVSAVRSDERRLASVGA